MDGKRWGPTLWRTAREAPRCHRRRSRLSRLSAGGGCAARDAGGAARRRRSHARERAAAGVRPRRPQLARSGRRALSDPLASPVAGPRGGLRSPSRSTCRTRARRRPAQRSSGGSATRTGSARRTRSSTGSAAASCACVRTSSRARSARSPRARFRSPARRPSSRVQAGARTRRSAARPAFAQSLQFAVVHHTAGANGYTAAQSAAIVRAIQIYHVKGNGWNDIGYNFLVDKYGQVFEGRYGGVERNVIGAHAEGFNTGIGRHRAARDVRRHEADCDGTRRDRRADRLAAGRRACRPASRLSWISGGNARFPSGRRFRWLRSPATGTLADVVPGQRAVRAAARDCPERGSDRPAEALRALRLGYARRARALHRATLVGAALDRAR